MLLCDAAEGVAEQDAKILGLAVDRNRRIVIALNKTDLLDKKELTEGGDRREDELLLRARGLRSFTLSAKLGRGVGALCARSHRGRRVVPRGASLRAR